MSDGHEVFDKAALYILTRAYEAFPKPVEISGAKEIREAVLADREAIIDLDLAYVPGFLARNGYIERFETLGIPWRIALNDKGLLALKKRTLLEPNKTVYEKIKEASRSGFGNISQGVASSLISEVITTGFFT